MSVSIFNSIIGRERVADKSDIKNAPLLTAERYKPDGSTPLYDAIANTVQEVSDHDGPVLFVIQTDGEENASQKYKKSDIVTLIAEKTRDSWQFIYLACDLDAMIEGEKLGIAATSTLSYSTTTARAAMRTVSDATVSYAAAGSMPTPDFFGSKDSVDLRADNTVSSNQTSKKMGKQNNKQRKV